jgi:hypothetical protein
MRIAQQQRRATQNIQIGRMQHLLLSFLLPQSSHPSALFISSAKKASKPSLYPQLSNVYGVKLPRSIKVSSVIPNKGSGTNTTSTGYNHKGRHHRKRDSFDGSSDREEEEGEEDFLLSLREEGLGYDARDV